MTTTPCSICARPLRTGKGSLPPGRITCRPCRRRRREPNKSVADHWYCKICNVKVERTSGPIGMYCKTHKYKRGPRPHLVTITCKGCGAQARRSHNSTYCSPTCRPQPRPPQTELRWRQCAICTHWLCKPDTRKYCGSDECRRAVERAKWKKRPPRPHHKRQTSPAERRRRKHRQRARHYGVDYEPVNPAKVYLRDGWQCGICHKRVNPKLKYPNPMSASLDHVIPMALGGPHTYLNTQLAHLICNSMKSHHGTGDQLALIG